MSSSQSLAIKFEEKVYLNFDVELADIGEDIVYHFWPKREQKTFSDTFGKNLEDAFKQYLPEDADVRAAYTSMEEAALIMRHSDNLKEGDEPTPSYYVKVIGWANNPMSDKFLRDKVFTTLENLLEN